MFHHQSPRSTDSGAGITEYGAVILLVAAIVVAVLAAGLPSQISDLITRSICQIEGRDDCNSPPPEQADGADKADENEPLTPDRPEPHPDEGNPRAQPLLYEDGLGDGVTPTHASFATVSEDGTTNDRSDDGSTGPEIDITENGTGGDPGPDFADGQHDFDTWFGDPVPGDSLDERPDPPEWTAPTSPNEYDSLEPTEEDQDTWSRWKFRATVADLIGLDQSSTNMNHFLDNTGEPLEQDVNNILEDDDWFSWHMRTQQDQLVRKVLGYAMEEDISGPVTYPVHTGWQGYAAGDGSIEELPLDLQIAMGQFSYSHVGSITVEPNDDGTWNYSTDTQVHVRDTYDWHGVDDSDTTATVPGVGEVDDEELAQLTRTGLAQEFMMYGASDPIGTSGTHNGESGTSEFDAVDPHGLDREESHGPGYGDVEKPS